MNIHTKREECAAIVVACKAKALASAFSNEEDESAAATGVLIAAIEILNPNLDDRERMIRLLLGENE